MCASPGHIHTYRKIGVCIQPSLHTDPTNNTALNTHPNRRFHDHTWGKPISVLSHLSQAGGCVMTSLFFLTGPPPARSPCS